MGEFTAYSGFHPIRGCPCPIVRDTGSAGPASARKGASARSEPPVPCARLHEGGTSRTPTALCLRIPPAGREHTYGGGGGATPQSSRLRRLFNRRGSRSRCALSGVGRAPGVGNHRSDHCGHRARPLENVAADADPAPTRSDRCRVVPDAPDGSLRRGLQYCYSEVKALKHDDIRREECPGNLAPVRR